MFMITSNCEVLLIQSIHSALHSVIQPVIHSAKWWKHPFWILKVKGKKKKKKDRESKNMIIFISNKNVWGEIKAKCETL